MIKTKLADFSKSFEERLSCALTHKKNSFDSVYRAMEYSLLSGGKRLRPFILCEFYKACGGKGDSALDFACALEMIHTYSLIHDDLPCMDNDDLRRGKPTCHKAFGEDIALLAGDGLLTLAFETAAKTSGVNDKNVLSAILYLAKCAGADGMIGGQVIDLESENKNAEIDVITEMYVKKTGALIAAAAVIGTILAGGSSEMIKAAEEYAYSLGIAFQIKDDILDCSGDSVVLGKSTGSDDKNKKSTYVSLVGMKKAKEDVIWFTDKAIASLSVFGEDAKTLKELALYLIDRNH